MKDQLCTPDFDYENNPFDLVILAAHIARVVTIDEASSVPIEVQALEYMKSGKVDINAMAERFLGSLDTKSPVMPVVNVYKNSERKSDLNESDILSVLSDLNKSS